MSSSLQAASPKFTLPSNLDIALCIVLLRSQPTALCTVEYLKLLRSLTVIGPRLPQVHLAEDCNNKIARDRHLDGRKLNEIMYIAESLMANLGVKIVELQREKEALQEQVKKIQEAKSDCKKATPVKHPKRKGISSSLSSPSSQVLHCENHAAQPQEAIAKPMQLSGLEDLAIWSELAPRLLVSFRYLRHATYTDSGFITVTIQQSCGMLSRIAQSFCKGIEVNSEQQSSRLDGPMIAKSLGVVLHNSTTELLAALDKLHSIKIHGDHKQSQYRQHLNDGDKNCNIGAAFYAVVTFLTEILSSIHTNSVAVLEHTLTQSSSLRIESQKTHNSQGCIKPVSKDNLKREIMNISSHLVPDLGEELTEFFVKIIASLQQDSNHHNNLIEALTFKIMTLIGSKIVANESKAQSRTDGNVGEGFGERKGKSLQSKLYIGNQTAENERQIINELAGEETSWYWLKIFDHLLGRYRRQLESMNHGTGLQVDRVLKAAETSQTMLCRESMVAKTNRKLRETLLGSTSGSWLAWSRDVDKNSTQSSLRPTIGEGNKHMRITNELLLNEVWRMIGGVD